MASDPAAAPVNDAHNGGESDAQTQGKQGVHSPEQQRKKSSSKKRHPANARGKTAKAEHNGGNSNISGKYQNKKGLAADIAQRGQNGQARRAYGAIDLGTNNCRLLIAKPAGDSFVVVDAFSRVVRLGEGLGTSGRLSQNAMDRAVAALSVCADKLKRRNVCLARSVATEACRRADNGAEFINRVQRETGIMLDVITAEEEARLAVLGCHILLEPGQGPAMIFDIGGGSTELVLIDTDGSAPSIRDWVSVPWGVVSLTEGVPVDIGSRESRQAGYDAMRAKAAESFEEFSQRLPRNDGDKYRMLGTSGTVTTLASLHLKLPCYNRNAIDGLIVPSVSMRQISQDLGSMAPSERAKVPCIGSDRAELVIAGCAILEAILDIWPAERLGIADRGIREGILRSLMAHGVTPSGTATPQTGKKVAPDTVSGKTASGKKASGKKRSRNRSRKRTQSSDAARQDNSRQDRQ
jgi:exopolyphosphatase/guanosine-5'-triphosphate,3'-diphosphate pyrophosphatase